MSDVDIWPSGKETTVHRVMPRNRRIIKTEGQVLIYRARDILVEARLIDFNCLQIY